MTRPEDVPLGPGSTVDLQATSLEQACELAIQAAQRTNVWPAPVLRLRTTIGQATIAAVAARYRAIGWLVAFDGACPHQRRNDCYFVIDHPARRPTCRCGEAREPR